MHLPYLFLLLIHDRSVFNTSHPRFLCSNRKKGSSSVSRVTQVIGSCAVYLASDKCALSTDNKTKSSTSVFNPASSSRSPARSLYVVGRRMLLWSRFDHGNISGVLLLLLLLLLFRCSGLERFSRASYALRNVRNVLLIILSTRKQHKGIMY